jgi:hypothetical protein
MSTLTKRKKAVRKPASSKSVRAEKSVPAWIGSAVGKAAVRPGVDLTKPTLPPGKYL